MNRSTSFLLPRLNVTEEPTFNQTISLADLTERPTESFQLSEDRATTEAYALYHDFLNIFQTSLDAERNGYLIFIVVKMVVDSLLPNAEFGPNDHRKDASPF